MNGMRLKNTLTNTNKNGIIYVQNKTMEKYMNPYNCYNCEKRHETFTYDYCDATQQMLAKIGCCKDHQNDPDKVEEEIHTELVSEVVVDISHLSYDGC